MSSLIHTHNTEVLVIGAGSAGLWAALTAKAQGAEVTLVFKSGGNATLSAAGGHSVVMDETAAEDTPHQHFQDTMASGCYLNDPILVKILTEKGPEEIQRLIDLGVDFLKDTYGQLKTFHAGGHTYPRTLRCTGGHTRQLYKVLLAHLHKQGVIIKKSFHITELFVDRNRVTGALAMDTENALHLIEANAVILASGGLGQLYSNTTNPPGITGDGYILALKAGATLSDLEMVQFMPTSLTYPQKLKGVVVTDTLRGAGAHLLNNQHERFMAKYAPEKMELATRDLVARAIYQEISEGRGTINEGVYLDATHLDRQTIMQSFTNAPLLMAQGIDPCKELIEVAPSAHFSCGGVVIDATCATGIQGFWAAGEVCAGVHGANRLGANALTENLVFGAIAGEQAAKWAVASSEIHSPYNQLRKAQYLEDLDAPFSQTLQNMLEKIENELKEAVWQGAGIIREEKRMCQSLEKITILQNALIDLGKRKLSKPQYLTRIRLENMALLGTMLIESARLRRESRGVHWRLDYPSPDSIIYHTRIIQDSEGRLYYRRLTP